MLILYLLIFWHFQLFLTSFQFLHQFIVFLFKFAPLHFLTLIAYNITYSRGNRLIVEIIFANTAIKLCNRSFNSNLKKAVFKLNLNMHILQCKPVLIQNAVRLLCKYIGTQQQLLDYLTEKQVYISFNYLRNKGCGYQNNNNHYVNSHMDLVQNIIIKEMSVFEESPLFSSKCPYCVKYQTDFI